MNTRTQRTIAFNRENILKAADKLFSENGVEKTTMDQLAAEAGTSKPTLYGYFKDKEEVFFALVNDFMKKIHEKAAVIISCPFSYREKFLGVCEAVFELADQSPLYFEGLIGSINVDLDNPLTPAVYREIFEFGQRLNGNLEKLIDEGKRQGFFDQALETSALLHFFWSSLSGIVRMALRKGEYWNLLRLEKRQFTSFCFERLLYGSAGKGETQK